MLEVIVNPAGAGGEALKLWHQIEAYFDDIEHQVHFSSKNNDINDIASFLTSGNRDVSILLVGGDCSMNKLVNGIHHFDHVKVGFLACGSGNDLARSLHMSKDLNENIRKIKEGRVVRSLDLGQAEITDTDGNIHERRFNISCGIGFDAAICHGVNTSVIKKPLNKIHLGNLSYIMIALHTIFTHKRFALTVTNGEKKQVFPFSLFSVCMNEPYEGGGFAFCPDAKGDDGLLDLCTGGNLNQLDFFRIFPYAYKGNHVKFKEVWIDTTKDVIFETETPQWVHTDGETEFQAKRLRVYLSDEKLQMIN